MPRTRPVVAGLAVAVAAMLAVAPPASAHDQLVSSDPADGSTLDAPPAAVSLEFSADVLDVGTDVIVADTSGHDWTDEPPAIDGADVTARLKPGMPDGEYEARWRVVSADGHPIQGVIRFTVGEDAPQATGTASPTPEPTGAAGSPEAAAPTARAQASEGATRDQAAPGNSDAPRVVLVGIAGAGAALALLALVQLFRRRRVTDADASPSDRT